MQSLSGEGLMVAAHEVCAYGRCLFVKAQQWLYLCKWVGGWKDYIFLSDSKLSCNK